MVKEYKPDENLKLKLILSSYKKHPFWKKRTIVRSILLAIGILSACITAYFFYNDSGSSVIDIFTGLFSGFLIGGMPYIVYYLALRDTCSEGIRSKTRETLTLNHEGFINLYLPARAKRRYNYEEDIFKYTKVQRLEYYEDSRKLYIYGNYINRYYDNYFNKEIGTERGIKYKDNRLTLFMYYENSEDFLKTLSERCNKEIIKS